MHLRVDESVVIGLRFDDHGRGRGSCDTAGFGVGCRSCSDPDGEHFCDVACCLVDIGRQHRCDEAVGAD